MPNGEVFDEGYRTKKISRQIKDQSSESQMSLSKKCCTTAEY